MWAHPRSTATAIAAAFLIVSSASGSAVAATQPSPVSGVAVQPSGSSATVTWNAGEGANTYRVCLLASATADTCTKLTEATTGHSLKVSGLTSSAGTDYYARVHAYNGSLVSRSQPTGFNLTSTSTKAAKAPSRVSGIKVSGYAPKAVLSWSKSTGATSYRVCVRTTATAPCVLASPSSPATSVVLSGLKARSYVVKVSAYNSAGFVRSPSTKFTIRTAPPAAKPGPATGIKNVPNSSGVTISWNAGANTRSYKVCLLEANTTTACVRTSPATTTRKVVITGLKPNPGADFYTRISSYNGNKTTRSALVRFDLPVGKTGGFTVTDGTKSSLAFSWSATTNADTYHVQLATKSDFSGPLKTVRLIRPSSLTQTFSSLVPGTRYYPRIRPSNSGVAGSWVAIGSETLPTDSFDARVITYNLCGQDKCVNSTNKMKKWSTRKPLAGKIARATKAGIIATQESHERDTRFATQLPGYAVAAYKSAKTLLFDKSKFTRMRYGSITLDSKRKRYAVWAELEDRSTRTNFIVTDAHLEPYKNSSSDKTKDNLRYAQTKVLLAATEKINRAGLPVIHAGDFNSNKSNKKYPSGYDAPHKAFTEEGIPDTYDIAETLTYAKWNSSNQATNPPKQYFDHIDHIYVDPRITAKAWRVVINVTGSPAVYRTPFATDHNPVQADLVIPGQSGTVVARP